MTGFLATAQAPFLSRQPCRWVLWGVAVESLPVCVLIRKGCGAAACIEAWQSGHRAAANLFVQGCVQAPEAIVNVRLWDKKHACRKG